MKQIVRTFLLCAMLSSLVHMAAADDADKILKVCAPPNNMPNSNEAGEGFENKIASLIAEQLGWTVRYSWFPQTTGYIRNTLKKSGNCDLIIGLPKNFEAVATSRPYYRSTYALVYRANTGYDFKTPDDLMNLPPEKLKTLRIATFVPSPGVDWLQSKNLANQASYYPMQTGVLSWFPGKVVEEDLLQNKVDMAILWGPIAGYEVKKANGALKMVAFPHSPTIRFDFSFSVATRNGEKEWTQRIQDILDKNKDKIQQILMDYGVPLLDESGAPIQ